MSKTKTIRFASGSFDAPFSGIWRLVIDKNDIYIGSSKSAMSMFKISLHKSGVWVLAATKQSNATFENGNRRAKKWVRPLEHVHGVTRGPSILVPHTSLGSRSLPPDEGRKEVLWYQSPAIGETAEFSIYFVKPNISTNWNKNTTILANTLLADGNQISLLASTAPSPADFHATCEKILQENIFRPSSSKGFTGGSLLWVTESPDEFKVPLIVDLPIPIG